MENLDEDLIENSQYSEETLSDFKAEILYYVSSIKNGRIAILVIGIFQLIATIYEGSTTNWDTTILMINSALALIYLILYFISKERPFLGLLTTLIIYTLINLLLILGDPIMVVKGLILKIIIFYYLIVALKDAKRYSHLKNILEKHDIDF